ncbi:hypothetical protein F5144DRAFT_60656 [Chaetomium tenue]|uniref:Uncharacterized protein n=1 Tax=Chaetomium tenue TaxID=1854479 RepID=A0ACB7PQY1_9PEZI|nr:hypothetical protein F5144DRAFT_60656 [Chaetomium globosum]
MAVPGCPNCTTLDPFTDPLVAAVLHNRRHSPIARLPEDILLSILDYCDEDLVTRISLQQVSRQFRRLVLRPTSWDMSMSGNRGGTRQRPVRMKIDYGLLKHSPELHKKVLFNIRVDRLCTRCLPSFEQVQKESCKFDPRPEMPTPKCARCKERHSRYEFSKRRRGDVCYGRNGFVRVCRHKQISWSQIEAPIAQAKYDGSEVVRFKEHCKDPSHRRCPGSRPPLFRFRWYAGRTSQGVAKRKQRQIYLHLWWESHSRVNQLNLDGQGRLRAPFLRSLFRRTAMVRQPPLGAESDMGMSCFNHPQCRCVYYEIGNALGGSGAPTSENPVQDDTDDTSYIACLSKRPEIHQASSKRVNLERMSVRLCAKPPCVPRDDCIVTQYYRRIMVFDFYAGI